MAQPGLMTKNTTIKVDRLNPAREIDPIMAPKATIMEDWISVKVGAFFSVIDSSKRRYNITI